MYRSTQRTPQFSLRLRGATLASAAVVLLVTFTLSASIAGATYKHDQVSGALIEEFDYSVGSGAKIRFVGNPSATTLTNTSGRTVGEACDSGSVAVYLTARELVAIGLSASSPNIDC